MVKACRTSRTTLLAQMKSQLANMPILNPSQANPTPEQQEREEKTPPAGQDAGRN
jgi:hypothetical protein